MSRLNLLIKIKAPKEKAWDVLWDDTTYHKWTSTFSEGCTCCQTWSAD